MAASDRATNPIPKMLTRMLPVGIHPLCADKHGGDFPVTGASENPIQSLEDHKQPLTSRIGRDLVIDSTHTL
jgi:hypothetical protein